MKRGQTWMYPFDGFDWLGHFDGKSDLDIIADVRQACVDLKGHAVSPSGKTFVDLCARNVEAIKLARSEKIRAGLEKKKGTENAAPPGKAESASGSSGKSSTVTPEASVREAEEGAMDSALCTSGAPAMVSRKAAREAFEAFRKAYPGTRRGVDVEWEAFLQKASPEEVPLLMPALLREKAHKAECVRVGAFCPPWTNLSKWIDERRWTQEFTAPVAPQARKTSEDLENDKKARMLRWLKDREAGIPTGDNYDEIPEVENTEDGNA